MIAVTPGSASVVSQCGRYRYSLERHWSPPGYQPIQLALWIMLNPSTADAERDDPTIRRCISFSKAMLCSGLLVANLYAYRTTHPRQLWELAHDPVGGRETDVYLASLLERSHRVICAWGQPGPVKNRWREVLRLIEAAAKTPELLRRNANMHPAHPLYLPADLKPRLWHFEKGTR